MHVCAETFVQSAQGCVQACHQHSECMACMHTHTHLHTYHHAGTPTGGPTCTHTCSVICAWIGRWVVYLVYTRTSMHAACNTGKASQPLMNACSNPYNTPAMHACMQSCNHACGRGNTDHTWPYMQGLAPSYQAARTDIVRAAATLIHKRQIVCIRHRELHSCGRPHTPAHDTCSPGVAVCGHAHVHSQPIRQYDITTFNR